MVFGRLKRVVCGTWPPRLVFSASSSSPRPAAKEEEVVHVPKTVTQTRLKHQQVGAVIVVKDHMNSSALPPLNYIGSWMPLGCFSPANPTKTGAPQLYHAMPCYTYPGHVVRAFWIPPPWCVSFSGPTCRACTPKAEAHGSMVVPRVDVWEILGVQDDQKNGLTRGADRELPLLQPVKK